MCYYSEQRLFKKIANGSPEDRSLTDIPVVINSLNSFVISFSR
ncbi:hypothetical protein FH603_4940 [Spirosoma sp. LMG 31447]|uniref:Uncharacterized protein n=1 Tax=Spirosoma utsteinense TaxID=2585773 RepID=A0ABR6WEI2_9BACT|nr:hypothetical protein [Spirosoma utsteinense]